MEKVREVDGYHQTLLWFPCYWSELETDGAIWGKTIDRYEAIGARWTSFLLIVLSYRHPLPRLPVPL